MPTDADRPSPDTLRVRGLRHAYGPTEVLQPIDLEVPAGRVVALIGPSGCGKTTLLHLCAGLLAPQQGRIEQPFAPAAVMFQQPRLLPWMSTLDNIALGLKARGVGKAERHARARAAALQLELPAEALAQYPAELSGGMQSRAALARALVLQPALLLMDEPFSALDVGLRGQLHRLLLARQADTGMAVLLITHDLMEAVRLADEVLVLAAAPGRIVARYAPPGAARTRGEALVHHCAAELQQHPAVRAAFGLPRLEAGQGQAEDRSRPPAQVAGAWLAAPASAATPAGMADEC
ncbi:NitT/TauT family transport system ATP-binding protein [Oryzisolibacter propanilivorax]|uniref:NitT/TauT family transport system ATP-binding protein n=1 Tax=Oryzisolibacter propanilivorax TaxID=1527607 RepID=A0A1G9TLP5_9BURK|nr:ATP-binding cassette domain-containing protein [Oryzisolibacter propanilivorax]SDM48590.1 NitT/TauT family transport system ATP-binding protein [Oryzisolibacter propanilivorax]